MGAEGFIAKHLRFKGKMAAGSAAISLFIIIAAVSIADGFRREIRNGLSSISGDINLSGIYSTGFSADATPVGMSPSYLDEIRAVEGVESIDPVIYRAGIIKNGTGIHGVVFKGTARDTVSMSVRIPAELARRAGVSEGDELLSYFVADRTKIRKFTVAGIYSGAVDTGEAMVVYLPISDLRRVNGWGDDRCSALEVTLSDSFKSRKMMEFKSQEIGSICTMSAGEEDDVLIAVPACDTWSQLYDWLDLIDFNVYAIMFLMMVVAGFNMISAVLIMLFRNIQTIGTLKAMGMGNRKVSEVFLRVSARSVLTGIAIGNAAALLFCLIQGSTHIISLNPQNYFVSYVPIYVNTAKILLADAISFAVIMVMTLVPTVFISKIDPSLTVKTE